MSAEPTGLLIANLGTPDAPTPAAVRRYLRAFLSDPRIIEWPRALWLPVLHGVVLRVRPRRSARLYESIWRADGSPLRVTSLALAEAVRMALEARGWAGPVALGMRYGEPSVEGALRGLLAAGVRSVTVLPLFPQYSATTTASIFDAVFDALRPLRDVPALHTVRGYHNAPAYLDALAGRVRAHRDRHGPPDRLLMSFHGIPARYALAGDPYPRQCEETARALAGRLGLADDRWALSYQSQFGPEAWLAPATVETLREWGAAGVERADVICPGFAVDSLETLEEIAVEGRAIFRAAGGGELRYIPALNAAGDHAAALAEAVFGYLVG